VLVIPVLETTAFHANDRVEPARGPNRQRPERALMVRRSRDCEPRVSRSPQDEAGAFLRDCYGVHDALPRITLLFVMAGTSACGTESRQEPTPTEWGSGDAVLATLQTSESVKGARDEIATPHPRTSFVPQRERCPTVTSFADERDRKAQPDFGSPQPVASSVARRFRLSAAGSSSAVDERQGCGSRIRVRADPSSGSRERLAGRRLAKDRLP
jgi:hypothetical protein